MKFRTIEKHLQTHGFNTLEDALEKLKDPQIEVDDAVELLACMRRIVSVAIRDKKSANTHSNKQIEYLKKIGMLKEN